MEQYFFDKRVIKKQLIKYGIMLAIALPFVITFNILCSDLKFWIAVLIDCAIFGVVVLICEIVLATIRNKRMAREEAEAEQKRLLLKERHKAEKAAKKKQNKTTEVEENTEK